jgi:hypothetical protein
MRGAVLYRPRDVRFEAYLAWSPAPSGVLALRFCAYEERASKRQLLAGGPAAPRFVSAAPSSRAVYRFLRAPAFALS